MEIERTTFGTITIDGKPDSALRASIGRTLVRADAARIGQI
jgi:hypothetical protein